LPSTVEYARPSIISIGSDQCYGIGLTQFYTYDDENRLATVEQAYSVRSVFTYDGLGRLRQREEYIWAWAPYYQWLLQATVRYVYDGMRVIQERESNTPQVSYTRGTDLSGLLEGAGGIGGLLARSHGYSGGNWSTHNFYQADGNGNITYLVNSSQTLAASYRYDPYGNTISSSGGLANANVYRFSSKELHVNSGLYYYSFRWYSPNLQRWLNRDPMQEAGGVNLYRFLSNDPTVQIDPFGLECPPFELPSRGPLRLELPEKKKRFTIGATVDGLTLKELTGTYSIGRDWDFSVSGNPNSGNVKMKIGGPIGGGVNIHVVGSPTTGGVGGTLGVSLGRVSVSLGGSTQQDGHWGFDGKVTIRF